MKACCTRVRVLGAIALTLAVSCAGSDDSPGRAVSAAATPSASSASTPSSLAPTSLPPTSPAPSSAPASVPPSAASSSASAEPAAAPSPDETSLVPGEGVDGGGTCKLLTPEEVSAELGVTVGDGRYTEAGQPFGNKICTWGSDELPARVYTLSLQSTADMAPALVKAGGGAPKLFGRAADLQRQKAGTIEAVTEIGREAFIVGNAIFALKGETFITANVLHSDGAEATDAVTELTRLAVSRL